jgi:ankyrin repeat protein
VKNQADNNAISQTDAIAQARQAVGKLCADWDAVCKGSQPTGTIMSIKPTVVFLNYDKTDIIEVCRNGDIEILQDLMKQGADIHSRDEAALQAAVSSNRTAMVEFLLNHQANVHARDDLALRTAVNDRNCDTMKVLLKHGANVHVNDDEPLRRSIKNAHADMVRLLLEYGANVHANNDEAIKSASMHQFLLTAVILLEYGAPVGLLTPKQRTDVAHLQQKEKERTDKDKQAVHAEETLRRSFQAAIWAGHVKEMQALWKQVPKPLKTALDFSSILAQTRVQTLKSSKPKVTIKK